MHGTGRHVNILGYVLQSTRVRIIFLVRLYLGVAIQFVILETLHDREETCDVSAAQCSVSVARYSGL